MYFWAGGTDRATYEASRAKGIALPVNHSPHFAPTPELTIQTGVEAMTLAVFEFSGGIDADPLCRTTTETLYGSTLQQIRRQNGLHVRSQKPRDEAPKYLGAFWVSGTSDPSSLVQQYQNALVIGRRCAGLSPDSADWNH